MGRLDGKVAVVVGGGTGFGLATSQRFAAEGATVVVLGRRADLAAEVGASVGGAGYGCDITDLDELEAVTAQIVDTHGSIDAAINYAGFQERIEIRDLTPDTLRPMVEVQLIAAIWFIRAMAMIAGGRVDLDALHSRTVGLDELGSALDDLDGGSADLKVLVDPNR